jgi:vitamin B12/bleomycin/antimicrobial peptide transport system ATP-binding/permease protein
MNKLSICLLIFLLLVDCALGAGIMLWRDPFWQAMSNKDYETFKLYIGYFTVIALLSCYVYGKTQYLIGKISLDIRKSLTNKALDVQTYNNVEGGTQRVQEDCGVYPTLCLSIAANMFRSIVMIISFTTIILFTLPAQYLIIPLIYVLIGTTVAHKIASPLITLNFINQMKEAAFRHLLSTSSEIAEHLKLFHEVYYNNDALLIQTKKLNYFQVFYNQIVVIIPYIILANLYFGLYISFGVLMQISSGMIELINQSSYIINSYSDINKLIASRRRLKECKII